MKLCFFYSAYDDDSDDEDGDAFGAVDIGASVKPAALSQMDAALDALSRELTKLRTGRASVGMCFTAGFRLRLL